MGNVTHGVLKMLFIRGFSDLVPGQYWNSYGKRVVVTRQSKKSLFCGEAALGGYFCRWLRNSFFIHSGFCKYFRDGGIMCCKNGKSFHGSHVRHYKPRWYCRYFYSLLYKTAFLLLKKMPAYIFINDPDLKLKVICNNVMLVVLLAFVH